MKDYIFFCLFIYHAGQILKGYLGFKLISQPFSCFAFCFSQVFDSNLSLPHISLCNGCIYYPIYLHSDSKQAKTGHLQVAIEPLSRTVEAEISQCTNNRMRLISIAIAS